MGRFIGEETYSAGTKSILDYSPTWIVDPIDGIIQYGPD
jgi:fructose-1,6-bisphosphatase/inositol monophosphatase family enzyme